MFSVTSLVETDVAAKECQERKKFLRFYRESKIHIFMSKKNFHKCGWQKLVTYLFTL